MLTPRRSRPDEGGFTLLETIVTSSVMLIVLAIFLGTFEMLNQTQVRIINQTDNQEVVRLTIDQLQRDIDSANPMDAAPSPGNPTNDIEVKIGPAAANQPVVQWIYSPSSKTLSRVLSGQSSTFITNVFAFSFSYYNDQGQQFSPQSDGTWTASELQTLKNCTIRVHVSINAAPRNPASPFAEDTDMQLRNRLPGGVLGCA